MKYRGTNYRHFAITFLILINVALVSACSEGADDVATAAVVTGIANMDGTNDGEEDVPQETINANGTSLFTLGLTAEQEAPPLILPTDVFSVYAQFTIDKNSGEISGTVFGGGIISEEGAGLISDSIGAQIHRGFAGYNGPVVITLEAYVQPPGVGAPDQPIQYEVPAGVVLDSDALAALAHGELYVNVPTVNNPNGEVRGQIIPLGVVLKESDLSVDEVVDRVFDSEATGLGITTVNEQTGAVSATVFLSGITDADAVEIRQGAVGSDGELVLMMEQDIDELGVWRSPESSLLTDAQLEAFKVDALYFNVTSPRSPMGEIRGQL